MNKRIYAVILCVLSFSAMAQYNSKGADQISRFRPGVMWYLNGMRPAKEDKIRKYDRLVFDLTYNDWVGDRKLFTNSWASIGLNTNFMFDIPMTKGNTVAFGIGVAHQFAVIRHHGTLIKNDSLGITTWENMTVDQPTHRNSLGMHTFSIPLEIRFRKESWKHLKFHLGAKVGYLASAYSKRVEPSEYGRLVSKDFQFPDARKFIYSAHLRFGVRNWALYLSTNFNTLFSNANSVRLNAVQMGLSISLF